MRTTQPVEIAHYVTYQEKLIHEDKQYILNISDLSNKLSTLNNS